MKRNMLGLVAIATLVITSFPATVRADWTEWPGKVYDAIANPGQAAKGAVETAGNTFANTALGLIKNALIPYGDTWWQIIISIILVGFTIAWVLIPPKNRERAEKWGGRAIALLIGCTIFFAGWAVIDWIIPDSLETIVGVIFSIVILVTLFKVKGFIGSIISAFKWLLGISNKGAAKVETMAKNPWVLSIPGAGLAAFIVHSQWLNTKLLYIPSSASTIAGGLYLYFWYKEFKSRFWICPNCSMKNKKKDNACLGCLTPNPNGVYTCSGVVGNKHPKVEVSMTAAGCTVCRTPNPHLNQGGPPPPPGNTPQPPPAGQGQQQAVTNCPHCNAPNRPQAQFCGSCGQSMTPPPARPAGGTGGGGGGNIFDADPFK